MTKESSQLTLEAVLRLKRHEKPCADFWEQFERDLAAKRLQALVKKEWIVKRWLRSLGKRAYALVPAAAMTAVSLVAYFPSLQMRCVQAVCMDAQPMVQYPQTAAFTQNVMAASMQTTQHPVAAQMTIPKRENVRYTVYAVAQLSANSSSTAFF